jgi:hypothetical protein
LISLQKFVAMELATEALPDTVQKSAIWWDLVPADCYFAGFSI